METILLIEDEERDQNYIREKIEKRYRLKIAPSYLDGLKALQQEDFDYIFLDLRLPKKVGVKVDERGTLGVKLLKTIKETLPLIPVVVVSGLPSPKIAMKLLEHGIVDFVEKDDLGDWLEALVKKGRLLKELCLQNKILRHEILGKPSFGGLITKSKIWEDIKETIAQVAPTEATVLITGETGTGKELVAREVVNSSPRREALYQAINCTQFSEGLLDSELFGHEKGAFTGADKRKIGILEAAHNGTVLLDEIGDTGAKMQVKLLRFLECGEFRRVGGAAAKKANVRIIAATSRDLKQKMKEGKFREDLYYRLNQIKIHLPPLRERKEDIDVLTPHFVKMSCREYGVPEKKIKRKTLNRLKLYDWPGNTRELRNLVYRAVLSSKSDTLRPEDFDIMISESAGELVKKTGCYNLDVIEKEAVKQALSIFKTKKEAAQQLGITQNTLTAKIDKYKLTDVHPRKSKISEIKVAKAPRDTKELSNHQQQILDHIKQNGFITNKTAREMFGVTQKTIVSWCQGLIDNGLIARNGSGRSTQYISMNNNKCSY